MSLIPAVEAYLAGAVALFVLAGLVTILVGRTIDWAVDRLHRRRWRKAQGHIWRSR